MMGCELVVHVINNHLFCLDGKQLSLCEMTVFASAKLTPTDLMPQLLYQYLL